MTIDIKELQSQAQLTITYTNDDGKSASATVVGFSKTEAENLKDEIIETHNLKEKVNQK